MDGASERVGAVCVGKGLKVGNEKIGGTISKFGEGVGDSGAAFGVLGVERVGNEGNVGMSRDGPMEGDIEPLVCVGSLFSTASKAALPLFIWNHVRSFYLLR